VSGIDQRAIQGFLSVFKCNVPLFLGKLQKKKKTIKKLNDFFIAFWSAAWFSSNRKTSKFPRVFQPITGFFKNSSTSRLFPGFHGYKGCQCTVLVR